MSIANEFKEYLKLARLHSAVLTGLAPVLGALSVGMLELYPLMLLFFSGLCTHIFGFVFNEYMDVEIDSKAYHLKNKPLVKGSISRHAAIFFAFSAIILGYIFTGFLLITYSGSGLLAVGFYTLAWLSIGIYDLTSKRICCSDYALAIWTGSLCLYGGFAAVESPGLLLFIIAGLAFFQLLIQNILAGLKDLTHDSLGLGTTTPLRMGVVVRNKKLMVPKKFQISIYCLKIIHMTFVFIPFYFSWLNPKLIQISIILFFLILNFLLVFKIFNSPIISRDNLLRFIGLHEILSYSIVPIMLFGIINIQIIIFLLIFPTIWLAVFLKIIYRRLVPEI
jgi:4-hydroxybenzoate polyprenyltransferase